VEAGTRKVAAVYVVDSECMRSDRTTVELLMYGAQKYIIWLAVRNAVHGLGFATTLFKLPFSSQLLAPFQSVPNAI
jgi:hypothetical protein